MDTLPAEIYAKIIVDLTLRDIRALRCTCRYANDMLGSMMIRELAIKYHRASFEVDHPDNNILAAVKAHDIELVKMYKELGGNNRHLLRAAAITNDLDLFIQVENIYTPEDITQVIQPAIRHDCRRIVEYIIEKYPTTIDYNLCLPTTAFCSGDLNLTKRFEYLGAKSWRLTMIIAVILGNYDLVQYVSSRLPRDNTTSTTTIQIW